MKLNIVFINVFILFILTLTNLGATNNKNFNSSSDGTPIWFKNSFLNISEDIDEATKKSKHLMIFFSYDSCSYCVKMMNENFVQNSKSSRFIQQNFEVVELNIKGDKELTWIDGRVLNEKKLADLLRIQHSPTILFFSPEKEIVARVNGYRDQTNFQYILDFVKSKVYVKMDLSRYLSKLNKDEIYKFRTNNSFKNLEDLLNISTSLAIILEDSYCTQCEEFHNEILTKKDVQDEMKKFTVVRFDANSTKEIILPDGKKTTPKILVERMSLDYRPAVLLYNEGKLISVINSFLYSNHFKTVLEYVSTKQYYQNPKYGLGYLERDVEKHSVEVTNID